MIDIADRGYVPRLEELIAYVQNPLFDELCTRLDSDYQPQRRIEYSGDKVLLGWNLKFKKAGRTLCTLYPREGYFLMLLVVGRREKPYVEALLPALSKEFTHIYRDTREGMGQRWLLLTLRERGALYEDALKIIHIRRKQA